MKEVPVCGRIRCFASLSVGSRSGAILAIFLLECCDMEKQSMENPPESSISPCKSPAAKKNRSASPAGSDETGHSSENKENLPVFSKKFIISQRSAAEIVVILGTLLI